MTRASRGTLAKVSLIVMFLLQKNCLVNYYQQNKSNSTGAVDLILPNFITQMSGLADRRQMLFQVVGFCYSIVL
jgi:hypothetical protein